MNLSYGETEYDYRLFPCLRVTDLRKKPGGTLRPRWTGFTSMRVQGLMVSVSKWQVHCPNSSHSAFVIPTATEISWVVGIWYSLDHMILVIPLWLLKPFQFQTSNQKILSLLYWILFIQLWWSFLKIWRRFCYDKYPMDPSELINDSN